MNKELEKIYNEYFPFEHQNCSDECGKKSTEIEMRKDFIESVGNLFLEVLPQIRTMNEDNPQYVLGWNACRATMEISVKNLSK